MDAKITQLVVQPATKNTVAVRTFAAKPAKDVARANGKLFGLIEIRSKNEAREALIDFLIDEIKSNYYDGSSDVGRSVAERFEAALKKTNIAFTTYLERERVDIDLNKTNIMLGVSHGRDIHFTVVGKIWSVLFYHVSKGQYRIINIIDSTQSQVTSPDPLKLFSQVISGRIRTRDVVLVTTENVFDYFSLERVKTIITRGSVPQGLAELRGLLSQGMQKESFGLLSLELEESAPTTPAPLPVAVSEEFDYQQAATKDSINQLMATERQTERLLTPSLKPDIKKYAASLVAVLQNYFSVARNSASSLYKRSSNSDVIRRVMPRPNIMPNRRPPFGRNGLISKITAPLRGLVYQISMILRNQTWVSKASEFMQRYGGQAYRRYRALPVSSQRLLLITAVLIILLVNSTVWLGINQRRNGKLEAFNRIVVEATSKSDEAESSLIYRDENLARQLLIDAKNLLAGAKPASKSQEEQIVQLENDIAQQLNELQHIIDIKDPIQIANFKNIDSQAQMSPFLVISQGFLFAQNQTSKAIFKTNISSRTISSIVSQSAGTYSIGLTSANGEVLLYGAGTPTVRLVAGRDELELTTLSLPANTRIDDITAFNGRLYVLNRGANQIYRLTRSGNTFGSPVNWIRASNISLENTTSMIVDGSMYIVNTTGGLVKLENGQLADFTAGPVDPPLQSLSRIRSPEGSPYLYILEPASKRVIVFNKQGGLVQQYTSKAFTDLKDIAVDEQDKKIYVLSGTTVYGIPATHLE